MKIPLSAFLLLMMLVPPAAADVGSLLILKNVYVHQDVDDSGPRVLLRERQAYDVVDIHLTERGAPLFRIRVPNDRHTVNGSGFIVESASELKVLAQQPVKVYPQVMTRQSDLTRYHLVPPPHLSFTGVQQVSPDFPHLVWRAVNFKTHQPLYYWVADWAGIYRPDKPAEWLNRTYQRVLEMGLDEGRQRRILLGLVEAGFNEEQVQLTLGDPASVRRIGDGDQVEWVYGSRKVIFQNRQVVQVL